MAYPVIIPPFGDGYALGDSPVGQFGFEYGGFQYIFLFEGGLSGDFTGDLKIHALRSADYGVTWIEQDAANAIPGTCNISFGVGQDAQYTVVRDGTTAWLMQTQTTAGTIDGIQVASFSLVTNTWTASALHVAPVIDFYLGTAITLKLVRRGANDMLLYYSGPRETVSGTPYARCYFATWSSGVFGTETALPGQAGNTNRYLADSAVCDSAGITHFFYLDSTATRQYHVGMTAGGAFGTPAIVHAALYSTLGVFSEPIIYGSPDVLALAGDVIDSGEKILFFSAPAVLNPTWSQAVITSTDVLTSNSAGFLIPRAIAIQCFNNTTLAAVWTTATGNHDQIGFYFSSTSPASAIAWTASAKLWDAPTITTDWASAQVYAYEASTGIGLVGVNGVSSFRVPSMESSESTQYYLIVLATPPTPIPDVVTLYAWTPNALDPTLPPFNLPPQFTSDHSAPPERRINGAIDGANMTFTLARPELITEIMLFMDGLMMFPGFDYNFDYNSTGNVITFLYAPPPGAVLTASVFAE